jgi:superfamily II DNA/RNA helicase
LVVDEADRLLRQRYNDWLKKLSVDRVGNKFIVSATLTRDPLKLEVLALRAPRFITFVQEENKYKLPPTLQETKMVIPDADKPAALCCLLLREEHANMKIIVFVSSVEAATTLSTLLNVGAVRSELQQGGVTGVEEYSGRKELAQEREQTIARFKGSKCSVLICSDAITRGIDIPGVELVINYDAPVYAKTYVHRAGRTARAGRVGKVVTLLRKEDVRHFKDILRKADNNYVKDEDVGWTGCRWPVGRSDGAVEKAHRGGFACYDAWDECDRAKRDKGRKTDRFCANITPKEEAKNLWVCLPARAGVRMRGRWIRDWVNYKHKIRCTKYNNAFISFAAA